MDTQCIEIRCGGVCYHLSYEELRSSDVQSLLAECYALGADVGCLCNPDRPVPMHLRRVRIRPPTYTLVTNRYGVHHPDCPRFRIILNQANLTMNNLWILRRHKRAREKCFRIGGCSCPPLSNSITHNEKLQCTKTDPCMVVAAAGSGKTTILIARIKNFIDQGVKPRDILACTFTRKAAQEMTDRLLAAVGERGKAVTIGTIHSVAYRMVTPELGEDWRVLSDPTLMVERVLGEPSSRNPHGVGPVMKPGEAISAIAKAVGSSPRLVRQLGRADLLMLV